MEVDMLPQERGRHREPDLVGLFLVRMGENPLDAFYSLALPFTRK